MSSSRGYSCSVRSANWAPMPQRDRPCLAAASSKSCTSSWSLFDVDLESTPWRIVNFWVMNDRCHPIHVAEFSTFLPLKMLPKALINDSPSQSRRVSCPVETEEGYSKGMTQGGF